MVTDSLELLRRRPDSLELELDLDLDLELLLPLGRLDMVLVLVLVLIVTSGVCPAPSRSIQTGPARNGT
jgi:hypothetical protein